jgi:cytidine deaminase
MPTDEELITLARRAREQAYAPYSGFAVGAAVVDREDRVFTGCNIENASYGATICAERTAVSKAVSEGSRKIRRLVVACGAEEPGLPCGICRQVLAEFADADFLCLCVCGSAPAQGRPDPVLRLTLDDLLPHRFQFRPD